MRKKFQQTGKRILIELSQKIQLTEYAGNIRGMYDGIKKAIQPVQKITSSQKVIWCDI